MEKYLDAGNSLSDGNKQLLINFWTNEHEKVRIEILSAICWLIL